MLAQQATLAPPPADSPDLASETACLRAAALDEARIGPATRFSAVPIEARIVDGRAPGAADPQARVKLLCLYDAATGRAETRPFDPDQATSHSRQVRDVWWHAVEISGTRLLAGELISLSLGGDGRVTGRSGCNLYSALYRLNGDALEVIWPMTGTRRACLPALMDQELRFRQILLSARSLALQPDGALLLTGENNSTVRFVRAEGQMRPATSPVDAPQPR